MKIPPWRRVGSALAPILLYLGVILALSSIAEPAEVIPRRLLVSDKLLHAVEYTVLGLLFARALRLLRPSLRALDLLGVTTLLCMGIGALDEFYQWHQPTRSAQWGDVVADTIGGAIGALLFLAGSAARKRWFPRATPAQPPMPTSPPEPR